MRSCVLVIALLAIAPSAASAVDLHRLWDERCAECHEDAGTFARQTLKADDGRLLSRRPERDLRAFLLRHQGGLPPAEAEGVYAMLSAQARTPPLFREKCSICHVKAADLVRDSLILRDGVLVGRYSGRIIADFLAGHGRLEPDQVPVLVGQLSRIVREVRRAPRAPPPRGGGGRGAPAAPPTGLCASARRSAARSRTLQALRISGPAASSPHGRSACRKRPGRRRP